MSAATTPDRFLTWADEGLYRSKTGGRNRVSAAGWPARCCHLQPEE
jgi:PleD family two-component response regulator